MLKLKNKTQTRQRLFFIVIMIVIKLKKKDCYYYKIYVCLYYFWTKRGCRRLQWFMRREVCVELLNAKYRLTFERWEIFISFTIAI